MKFLKRLTLAFHVICGLFVLTIVGLFLANLIPLSSVLNVISVSYSDHSLKILWIVILGMAVILNYLLFLIWAKGGREKQVIPFENPAGKIRVSIFALEELAKRVASSVTEVKDVQVKMDLSSKGLDVDLKLALCSDANILEVTSNVQNLVRRRIQETISLDQPINVSAYVSKIDPVTIDSKTIKGTIKNPYTDIHVPFQGYRA